MRELLLCLQDWLARDRQSGSAYSLFCALTAESLKRVASADPEQREFDAEALAPAAGGPNEFESAKRWIDRAKLELFAEARRSAIEQHFRAAGFTQGVQVVRRSPKGKHRAVWYLEAYPLNDEPVSAPTVADQAPDQPANDGAVQYEFTPPGGVRAAWFAWLLIGPGSFFTKSWRGFVWVAAFLLPLGYLAFNVLMGLTYVYAHRPLQTSDLAAMLGLLVISWVVWRIWVRPLAWLIDDRIIPATEVWVAWNEANAQLELASHEGGRRKLQLVRYTAVCPICAGTVELRYSQGPNRRRLVGCCNEAPHDHVFSFDRVSRVGRRLHFD